MKWLDMWRVFYYGSIPGALVLLSPKSVSSFLHHGEEPMYSLEQLLLLRPPYFTVRQSTSLLVKGKLQLIPENYQC
jgi:hypothetical protein